MRNQKMNFPSDNQAVQNDQDALWTNKETSFYFRKDEKGVKRETITLNLPVPTENGIADIFNQGGKSLGKLISLVETAIREHVKIVIDANPSFTSTNFPMSEASWEAYLAVPEAEAKSRGISKETWEAFKQDYISVMPALIGKTVKAVENAASILVDKRFSNVKTDKAVLAKLQEYLAIYAGTANAENFAECIAVLDDKATALLAADSSDLLNNI